MAAAAAAESTTTQPLSSRPRPAVRRRCCPSVAALSACLSAGCWTLLIRIHLDACVCECIRPPIVRSLKPLICSAFIGVLKPRNRKRKQTSETSAASSLIVADRSERAEPTTNMSLRQEHNSTGTHSNNTAGQSHRRTALYRDSSSSSTVTAQLTASSPFHCSCDFRAVAAWTRRRRSGNKRKHPHSNRMAALIMTAAQRSRAAMPA